MIGFACPWCDHEVSLLPQAMAAGSMVCPECSTQVDVAVVPAAAATEHVAADRDLALAA
jgi:transcription elongation factor Elf1